MTTSATATFLLRINRRCCRPHDFSAGSTGLLERLRQNNEKDINNLPEYNARTNLSHFLGIKAGRITSQPCQPIEGPCPPSSGYQHVLTPQQMLMSLDAAMATFHLHVESRIASLCGQGFYTIGPCGEEMLASIGHALDPNADAIALHYRCVECSYVHFIIFLSIFS